MLFQPELGAAGVTTQPLLAPPAQVEALPTLFVTREIKEHANVYHTMTGGWSRARQPQAPRAAAAAGVV